MAGNRPKGSILAGGGPLLAVDKPLGVKDQTAQPKKAHTQQESDKKTEQMLGTARTTEPQRP